MDKPARSRDRPQAVLKPLVTASAAYEGGPADIAAARHLARGFLDRVQTEHCLPVSGRAMGMVQLVVSELITNACRHAPGPCLLDLEVDGGTVKITVWDSEPMLPNGTGRRSRPVGQHGLEIVMAAWQDFEVHREPVGKRTVASVMLADDPGGVVSGSHR
ncbi:ATP-binding protein [Streptomyces barringtoniae]|uniref:ATP-binding protein n=1 Tax=Streptomyces barringtoniae TaxID=2892029 RepID=UPI001E2F9C2A|nr:ATP-binding protein [Streptomyces barringtoniae]MCC5478350.1 ATP-binding protein [Streptomyces barringtoniae]